MAALVDLGIDVNAKNEDGLTAPDYPLGRGYVPFQQLAQAPRRHLADLLRSWGMQGGTRQDAELAAAGRCSQHCRRHCRLRRGHLACGSLRTLMRKRR